MRFIRSCSFRALFVKIRDSGTIRNKAVYLALSVNLRGDKELLGLWIEQNKGKSSGTTCSPN